MGWHETNLPLPGLMDEGTQSKGEGNITIEFTIPKQESNVTQMNHMPHLNANI